MWLAGGIAGCVSKTCTAPLSRVCVLMQVQSMRPNKYHAPGTPNNLQLIPALNKVISEEGFFSLWRGNGAAMLHRFGHSGAIFTIAGRSKAVLKEKKVHPTIAAIVGGMTGAAVGNTVHTFLKFHSNF